MVKILLSGLIFVNFYVFNLASDNLQRQSVEFYELYNKIKDGTADYKFAKEKLNEIIKIDKNNFLGTNARIILERSANVTDSIKDFSKSDMLALNFCNIYILSVNKEFEKANKVLVQIKRDVPSVDESQLNSIYENVKNFSESQASLNTFVQSLIALGNEKPPRPINFDEVKSYIIYPNEAVEENIEGKVKIKILIDETGNVIETRNFEGDEVFKEVVRNAVLKLKFIPAMQYNEPIKSWIAIPYTFELSKKIEKDK